MFITICVVVQLWWPEQSTGVETVPDGPRHVELADSRDELSRGRCGVCRRSGHGQSRGQVPLLRLPPAVHERGGRPDQHRKVIIICSVISSRPCLSNC